jgi:hypothetical protein
MTTFNQNKYSCKKCGVIWSGSLYQDYCQVCTQTKILKDELRNSNQNNSSSLWSNTPKSSLTEHHLQQQLNNAMDEIQRLKNKEIQRQREIDRKISIQKELEKQKKEKERIEKAKQLEREQYSEEDAFKIGKKYYIENVYYKKYVHYFTTDSAPYNFSTEIIGHGAYNRNLEYAFLEGMNEFLTENIIFRKEKEFKTDLYHNTYICLRNFFENRNDTGNVYADPEYTTHLEVGMKGGSYFETSCDNATTIPINSNVHLEFLYTFDSSTGKYDIIKKSFHSNHDEHTKFDKIIKKALMNVMSDVNSSQKCKERIKNIKDEERRRTKDDRDVYNFLIVGIIVFLLLGMSAFWKY